MLDNDIHTGTPEQALQDLRDVGGIEPFTPRAVLLRLRILRKRLVTILPGLIK
ncbi:hypothetical protein JKY72_02525 [Candidatus Gracilibacteria bacterium]|nr:hypothetical protein [Candidatus Gracilibacteria bacterium]